jgi:hypothetical protein
MPRRALVSKLELHEHRGTAEEAPNACREPVRTIAPKHNEINGEDTWRDYRSDRGNSYAR